MVLIVVVAVFAMIGVYRTIIKPDKPWHRIAVCLALVLVFMLPAMTSWGPIR